MISFKSFIHRKMFFAIAPFIVLAASQTQAGFEWVPQKKQPAMQAEVPVMPAPTFKDPVPVDDVVLPLPSDADLAEPTVAPVMPEPINMEKSAELPPVETMEPQKPAAPTRIVMTPKEAPNSGATMNTSPEPSMPPLDVHMSHEHSPEALKKPPVTMTNTRIIMPEDAPVSAVQQTEKNNVVITAFPGEAEMQNTQPMPLPMAPIPAPSAIEFAQAVGFAKDIPLALALGQVVPADYAYSFGTDVNPGLRVSWSGGKPWNEVVAEMIVPLGYSVTITQKSVRISNQKISGAPAFIEPAAGIEEDIALESLTAQEDKPMMKDASRTREIKRVGITDPGIAEQQEPTETAALEDISQPENQANVVIQTPTADAGIIPEHPQKVTFWTAEAGASLKETLIQWSDSADADLVWEATHDFQLPAAFEVQGSFEKAVDLLLKHGLGPKNASLSHSLGANTNEQSFQIIINDAA